MTSGSLARRYARALMAIAKEEGKVAEYGDNLESLGLAILQAPGVLEALANVSFPKKEREQALSAVLGRSGQFANLKNFLTLLLQKERIGLLEEILREFGRMRDEELGIVRVRAAAPAKPARQALEEIESLLGRHLAKKVIADGEEDSDLLGGMVLKVGETIYDGSIKRQLELMKENLLREQLN